MKLESKKIVITGASSGIGKETLNLLLKEGALVVVGDLNPDIIPEHPNLHKFKVDISKPGEVDRLIENAIEVLEKIDVFFANAGFGYYEKIQKADWTRIKSIYATNVFSPIYTIQSLTSLLPKGVHIIVTASALAYLPLPGFALYASTKAAIHSFADAFRFEMGKQFRLTLVYPVSTKTYFFEKAGNSVPEPWPTQSAGVVAKNVVSAIKKPRNSVYPSFLFRMMMILNRYFPIFFPIYRFWQNFNFQNWQKKTEAED